MTTVCPAEILPTHRLQPYGGCLDALRLPGWHCQWVEDNSADDWAAAMAAHLLCGPEWQIWQHLPRPARQRRWMRGRLAAKDAVRRLLQAERRMEVPLNALTIVPDHYGQPHVACAALPERGIDICVSISHCDCTAVALATARSMHCQGVGIDIASQTDNHDGLAEGGFTAAETALLNCIPSPERADWLLRLWCAKEAVGKALGVGLQGDPHSFVIDGIDPVRQTVAIITKTAAARHEPRTHPVRITAHVGCARGMAYAVANWRGI